MEVGKNEACAYYVKANGTAIVLETTMFLRKIKLLQIFNWNFVKVCIYTHTHIHTQEQNADRSAFYVSDVCDYYATC